MSDPATDPRSSAEEHGSAIVMVIVIMILAAGIIAALVLSSRLVGDNVQKQTARAVNFAAAESGIAQFELLLRSGRVNESHGYRPSFAAMQAAASGAGGQLVNNANPWVPAEYRTLFGAGFTPCCNDPFVRQLPAVSVRVPNNNGTSSYWQVFRVVPQHFGSANNQNLASVVVYIRAWVAPDAQPLVPSQSRTIRVEYTAGSFTEYQLATDAPLTLESGFVAGGRVHSNGRSSGSVAIRGDGTTTCTSQDILNPDQLTTGVGTIVGVPKSGGCTNQREDTGKRVNLLQLYDHLKQLGRECTSGPGGGLSAERNPLFMRCWTSGAASYRVNLGSGNPGAAMAIVSRCSNSIDDPGGCVPTSTQSVPITTVVNAWAPGSVLVFDSDVRVMGQTRGRVTIAAVRDPASGTGPAARIRLGGGQGTSTTIGKRQDGNQVVGLLAEGDIVLSAQSPGGNGVCLDRVNASMISAAGGLTVDEGYLTNIGVAVNPCPKFTVWGSLVSAKAPALLKSWGSADYGYARRSFEYDDSLIKALPANFPEMEAWRVTDWSDASEACLYGGALQREKPTCR